MSDTSQDSAFRSGAEEGDATVFGMWIFIASEAMVFGAVLLVYALGRIRHAEAFAAGSNQLDWRLGTLNTAVLLLSSFAVARAHAASEIGATRRTRTWMLTTAVLGVAFLSIKGWEWHSEVQEGLAPLLGLDFAYEGPDRVGAVHFFQLYFVLTALHAMHMLGGLACIGWLKATWHRRKAQADLHAVRTFGLYWHFVDIVWIFLFPLLYLVGRS